MLDPAIREALSTFGGRREMATKTGRWYAVTDEVVLLLDPQKSAYGKSWYINIGVSLRAVSDNTRPKLLDCQVMQRLETIAERAGDRKRVESLLNLEDPMDDEARTTALVDVFERYLGPIVEAAKTVQGVRELVSDGPLRSAGVTGPGQALLRA